MQTRKVLISLMAASMAVTACAQRATVITTTADRAQELRTTTIAVTQGQLAESEGIVVKTGEPNQSIDGFGFAVTYSSCYNLLKMTAADRHRFLERTYSEENGLGVNYARISIGCNDFSSTEYTLCDTKGPAGNELKNFGFYSDETDYVLPVLKEILSINPNVKIIGAPWTCPRWMKVNNLEKRESYNSWTNGHLNPIYYKVYADYFVKFIQLMKQEGINIYAVCPQNEPLNKANCASLYMPWSEEADFVKEMAAAFKKNEISTKIYLFDHNYNYDNVSDQNDYPVKIYKKLGNDFEGAELVVGAAYHDYGGNNSELSDIHGQAPDKELIFTESSIGTWNDGRNLTNRLIDDMRNITIGTVNRHCRAVMVWNLMLDLNRGPNLDGGCQTCYGAVDIDQNNYRDLSYNSHYFVITHMAAVVKPGAVRVNTSAFYREGVDYAAFVNPDGTRALTFVNASTSNQTMPVSDGTSRFDVVVPARSVVSVKWGENFKQPVIDGQEMTRITDAEEGEVYSFTGTFTKGKTYHIDGLAELQATDWYANPDFFTPKGDGGYEFQAVTGNYALHVSQTDRWFSVWPLDAAGQKASLQADGTGAVWVIGAFGSIGKPRYLLQNVTAWSSDRHFPLAQVSPKVYQLTLTVGQQLSAKHVNFKFFHQAGWTGGEFKGKDGDYLVSSDSQVFVVGDGSRSGFDNGNIYLGSGQSLTEGDTYVLTLDLSADPRKARLTACAPTSGILPVTADRTASNAVYDLQGRRVSPTRPGLYIRNGKKFFVQ